MDNMEKLVKKHNNNLLRKNDTNKQNCNCRANNTCLMVNVYHQTLFIQLKSLLATINMETNTLVSVKENSKPG